MIFILKEIYSKAFRLLKLQKWEIIETLAT